MMRAIIPVRQGKGSELGTAGEGEPLGRWTLDLGNDRFYMNEKAAESFLQAQRQRALIGGGILLLLFLIYVLIAVLA